MPRLHCTAFASLTPRERDLAFTPVPRLQWELVSLELPPTLGQGPEALFGTDNSYLCKLMVH
jgi:hypothetical protein